MRTTAEVNINQVRRGPGSGFLDPVLQAVVAEVFLGWSVGRMEPLG
jgi:hypothetical protein